MYRFHHPRPKCGPRRRTLAAATATATAALLVSACGGGDGDKAPAPAADPLVVTTASGPIRGQASAAGGTMLELKGIPYAAPPVGPLRWRPPAPPASWTEVRDATAFGPACAQPASPVGTATVNEDCLTLNVFRPSTPGPHPVMVWIHGGAFYYGASAGHDPASLVAQGVVVVTINYRLGALGFMAHPALSAEQGGHSGNYGLMDQQAALRWVQANIDKFGGDKNNVTIFGESAGGFSVLSHLAAPESAGLFHKVIVMSGTYRMGATSQDTLAAAQTKGQTIATAAVNEVTGAGGAPCDTNTVACLRSLPASALLTAQMAAYPRGPAPSVDGRVLDASVRAKVHAGTVPPVPVIQGSTRDEYRVFGALREMRGEAPLDASTLPAAIRALGIPDPTASALASGPYNPALFGNNASFAYGALGTDLVYACTGLNLAKRLSGHGRAVYSYEFRDRTAPEVLPAVSFPQGAAHSAELQYLFDMPRPLNPEQQALKSAMVRYFTHFARTGQPAGDGLPAWAAFTAAAPTYLGLDIAASGGIAPFGTFATEHQCDTVWASLAN